MFLYDPSRAHDSFFLFSFLELYFYLSFLPFASSINFASFSTVPILFLYTSSPGLPSIPKAVPLISKCFSLEHSFKKPKRNDNISFLSCSWESHGYKLLGWAEISIHSTTFTWIWILELKIPLRSFTAMLKYGRICTVQLYTKECSLTWVAMVSTTYLIRFLATLEPKVIFCKTFLI